MAALRAALVWAVLFGMPRAAPSIPVAYCASVNTANMAPAFSIYQSQGRCSNTCTSLRYALAVVKDKNCWCSNLVPDPADQKPLDRCQNPCPGYPSDYCGGDGLFGYMVVSGNSPSGTAPPSSPGSSSSSTSDSSTSAPPTVQTVTVGGVVRTVTATPGPTSTGNATLGPTSDTGMPAGAIAGIVIGVVGGLAVIAAFVSLWLWKRRQKDEDDDRRLRSSSLGGGGSPGTMATSQTSEVAGGQFAGWDSSKRRSHLMPVDPRLDPYAKGIYTGNLNRSSRDSVNSLQDNQDYSRRVIDPPRVLRATNPDPEADD